MNNYRDKRQDGSSSRGNRERASFNPNFGSDNRVKRQRFNRNTDGRPQYERVEKESAGENRFRSYGRGTRDYEGGRFGNERRGGFSPARKRMAPFPTTATRLTFSFFSFV